MSSLGSLVPGHVLEEEGAAGPLVLEAAQQVHPGLLGRRSLLSNSCRSTDSCFQLSPCLSLSLSLYKARMQIQLTKSEIFYRTIAKVSKVAAFLFFASNVLLILEKLFLGGKNKCNNTISIKMIISEMIMFFSFIGNW